MITREDRDILRRTLSNGVQTTAQVGAAGWGPGAWSKLKEFMTGGWTERVGNPQPPFKDMDNIEWQLTPGGVAGLARPEPVASTTRFLRYSAWCVCERSCNAATRALEAGVSVYECYEVGAHWHPIDSRALSKNETTLTRTPWFLVTGEVQPSTGGDGEPLLKNVQCVSDLAWDAAAKRFALLNGGAFQHRNHPGHGTAAGCACT
jgi:hypothetical protein